MRSYRLVSLFIMLLTIMSTAIAKDDNFAYLGSYSFSRGTESGHTYASEFRLWRHGNAIEGVYLDLAGLNGDTPAVPYIITNGSLSANGQITLEAKPYTFTGKYTKKSLRGVLMSFGVAEYGGIDGSDVMVLKRGVTIHWLPEKSFNNPQELKIWLNSLKDKI